MSNPFELRRALRQIPDEAADPAHWDAIAARADALGLFATGRTTSMSRRLAWPLALAASVTLAVIAVRAVPPDGAAVAAPVPAAETAAIDALMRQSQLLESWLRHAPPAPRVVTVGAASREAVLRDRIAAIDWQLSAQPDALDMTEKTRLWSERSQHMRELVELRYRDQPRADL